MAKNRKPHLGAPLPHLAKVPRIAEQPNVQAMRFCWRVDNIDWDGPWGWSRSTSQDLLGEIIPKLHSFESMAWGQVDGATGSHFVEVTALVDEAQHRLMEIGKDEQARLFSLRITGERRVWGIGDIAVLRVLWWDPNHQVCPSSKKHT